MDKVKVGENEYTQEELEDLISKASDYTKKTTDVAEKARMVEERLAAANELVAIQQYAQANPQFKNELDSLFEKEIKRAQGIPVDDDVDDDDEEDEDETYNPYSPPRKPKKTSKKPKEPVVTVSQLKNVVQNLQQSFKMEQQNNAMATQISNEFDQLAKTGFTREELIRIGEESKATGRMPMEIAERFAFRGVLPDRFHKKPEPEDKPTIMKSQPSAILGIEDVDAELAKFGGDPAAMLLEKGRGKLFKED
jgi:hypothetical protein